MGFRNPLVAPPFALAVGSTIGVTNPPGSAGLLTAAEEVLLATVPSATTEVTVELPANCQALRILTGSTSEIGVGVVGAATGQRYGPVLAPAPGVAACEVDPAVDQQVTITLPSQAAGDWYIVATLATEIVSTVGAEVASLQTIPAYVDYASMVGVVNYQGAAIVRPAADSGGQMFVVSAAPGSTINDHPANDRLLVSIGATSVTTQLLAAPGASSRFRIYYAAVRAVGTAATGLAQPNAWLSGILGTGVCHCTVWNNSSGPYFGSGPAVLDCTDGGVPTPANTAIALDVSGGSASFAAELVYTVEAV